ncbi:MAG TPA: hypothetical protein VH394_15600 [Thermoanaerobaculia bacterium]|jgi:hypothetical protein|nr:hypothetical protein [Thermoanaerobaculia bacterium]
MAGGHVFHVIFFKDRDWWVAQCLERNLATASQDPRELPSKLETLLRVQIEADQEAGIEPFSALPQAPRRFWQMFQGAQPWNLQEAEPPVILPAWTELALA